MNKIDELVREMCPDGVEYKELGEICIITSGGDIPKENYSVTKTENFTVPIISNGVGEKALYGYTDIPKITETAVTISARGTIGYAEYRDYSYYPVVRLLSIIPYDKNELNCKYLYYCLQDKKYNVPITGIPQLTIPMIKNILIPLPPLEIQERIVNILDKFTDLTKELNDKLKKELDLRKKQYEYYRDYLLTFECTIDRIRIKDVADISRGKRLVKSDLSENGEYAVYQNALSPMGYYNSKNRNGGSVYLIGAGAAGSIGFSENDFWAADDCYTFECNEKITQKFLFYVLLNNQSLINSKVRKASIPRISRESIENIEIPLPSLDLQNRLVEVLDNFESICSNLNIILPADMEARQKQYEYYRDALLTYTATGNINVRQIDRQNIIRLIQYVFGKAEILLGDIGKVSMCKRIMKSETSTVGDVPFFKIGTFGKQPDAYISREKFEEYKATYSYPNKGDILISASGTIGRTVVFDGKDAYYQDSNIVWIANDESIVLNRYLYYYYQLQPWNASTGGTIARLYNDNISKSKISVPPIQEQKRIVSILDKFYALCNDLNAGLPAEIEMRTKQYEYYRDILLSFK